MKGCAAKGKQQGRNASTAYRGVEGRGAAAPADAAVASPDAISQSSSRSTSTAPDGAWKRREVQHQQHERRTLGLIRRDLGSSTLQHPVEADDLGRAHKQQLCRSAQQPHRCAPVPQPCFCILKLHTQALLQIYRQCVGNCLHPCCCTAASVQAPGHWHHLRPRGIRWRRCGRCLSEAAPLGLKER